MRRFFPLCNISDPVADFTKYEIGRFVTSCCITSEMIPVSFQVLLFGSFTLTTSPCLKVSLLKLPLIQCPIVRNQPELHGGTRSSGLFNEEALCAPVDWVFDFSDDPSLEEFVN